jgi:hypothetical protein
MKAKLIKTNNGVYDLFEDTRFISTTDSPDGTINKLSIKNCQAIEEQEPNKTIWYVEIIEECLDKDCDGINRKGDCITTGKPKLDADGCLILKKRNELIVEWLLDNLISEPYSEADFEHNSDMWDKAEEMERDLREKLKDFDTWKKWKNEQES